MEKYISVVEIFLGKVDIPKYCKYCTPGGVPVCGSAEHGRGGEGFDEQGLERREGEEARQQ